MSDNCKVPQVKPIVIKRFGTSGLIPTIPTTNDCNLWQKTDLKDGEFAVNTQDNKLYIRSGNQILELTSGGGSGSVTSVGLSMPSAFSVANSPITGSGTLVVTATGTTGEYIRGDGSLATFPTIPSFTPSALTKTDDTNITLTLGGTPNTALLEATSITVGWSGELAVSRGGTGAGTFTANNVLLGNGTSSFQTVAPGTSGNVLTSNGTTWVSQAPTGGGITIGTTAISSGTVGRVIFEGAGNVVQQDGGFVWNNTDKRLILGADQASVDTNPRLVVVGKNPSGTTTLAAFHNSTGNNNALVVRDDGFVGIGTNTGLFTGTNLEGLRVLKDENTHKNIAVFININNTVANSNVGSSIVNRAGTRSSLVLSTYTLNNELTTGFNTERGSFIRQVASINEALGAKLNFILDHRNDATNGFFQFGVIERNTVNSVTGTKKLATITQVGNLLIGTETQGASATKTLVINNGLAPTGNVTDSFQQYSADIVAGNAAPHFRTGNGDVVRLYRVGGWGLPTGSFTRTTFDTTTVTLQQLAERVAALIQDLRDNHQLLKA